MKVKKQMNPQTNLHLEKSEGKWYLYDTMASGHCICYGVFESENEAENALKEYKLIEAQSRAYEKLANAVMNLEPTEEHKPPKMEFVSRMVA